MQDFVQNGIVHLLTTLSLLITIQFEIKTINEQVSVLIWVQVRLPETVIRTYPLHLLLVGPPPPIQKTPPLVFESRIFGDLRFWPGFPFPGCQSVYF